MTKNLNKIKIFCTGDLHSNIPGAIKMIENLAGKRNDETIVLDLGDFTEGSPFYNLFKGAPEKDIINLLYDVVIPGNHGIEDILELNMKNLNVNIINANIYKYNKLVFKPSIVIEKKDLSLDL